MTRVWSSGFEQNNMEELNDKHSKIRLLFKKLVLKKNPKYVKRRITVYGEARVKIDEEYYISIEKDGFFFIEVMITEGLSKDLLRAGSTNKHVI